ncbi:MAG TPA: ABC transporter permease, partial [Vicinamibacterales bacterium]|nr:ABC transporter permease [Vicinamibacterales bacterium]
MRFVVRMAARELRAAWRRLAFFFVCAAVGVGAIVALRSVVQNVRAGLMAEARALLAADVVLSSAQPWDPGVRRRVEAVLRRHRAEATEVIETTTMAAVARQGAAPVARLVEVTGVGPAFPSYGEVRLEGGRTYSHRLLQRRGVLVRPELIAQFGLRIGDSLQLGGYPFVVRGAMLEQPGGRVGPFSLGSPVLVDLADLRATGLLGFGSRARYRLLVRAGDESSTEVLVRELRAIARGTYLRVRWFRATEEDIGEDLDRAERYLSLVGFAMVVIGGLGVWSVTRVFIGQRVQTLAVLKCLGADSRRLLAVYLLEVALLALAGSAAGVALAAGALAAVPERIVASVAGRLPGAGAIDVLRLTPAAVIQGCAVGLLVSLLFAVVPLL